VGPSVNNTRVKADRFTHPLPNRPFVGGQYPGGDRYWAEVDEKCFQFQSENLKEITWKPRRAQEDTVIMDCKEAA
jgi:hypothetical protein